MSAIISRDHAERITRAAAEAIGLTIPPMAKWSPTLGGLVFNPLKLLLKDGSDYSDNTFCPLNDPEHAYMIEVKLCINVFHRKMDERHYVLSLRSSEDAAAGALMQTVKVGDDAMRLRMAAVVQFAALQTLVEA